jgi:nucleoside-diphosphate kinase
VDRALAEQHYAEHQGKGFFEGLVSFITSSPVVVAVFAGPGAITTVRKTNGATNPANAEPGTVRGDFGVDVGRNLVHASDGPESAAREIALWFKEGELLPWERTNERWIRE